MKRISSILYLLPLLLLGSCTKQLGLQKDYNRDPHPLDPHIHKTALQYMQERATGTPDTLFKRMKEGIEYAGIDLSEYEKSGRTFIFMTNDAIYRTAKVSNKDSIQNDCLFGAYLINGKPGTKWSDYPVAWVKAQLQYLIVTSVQDHYTLAPDVNQEANTLAPEGSLTELPAGMKREKTGTFVANPLSLMKIRMLNSSPSNTSDYPIILNDVRTVRTSSILADNGTIHVIDRFLVTTVPQ